MIYLCWFRYNVLAADAKKVLSVGLMYFGFIFFFFFLEAGFQYDDIEAIDTTSVFEVSKWASLRGNT